jgi:hypothetical protein
MPAERKMLRIPFKWIRVGESSAAKIVLLFCSWTASPTGLNLELMDCRDPAVCPVLQMLPEAGSD